MSDWEDIAIGPPADDAGDWEDVAIGPPPTAPRSDSAAIGDAVVEGFGQALNFVDLFVPINPARYDANEGITSVLRTPPILRPIVGGQRDEPFSDVYQRVGEQSGALTGAKAETGLGGFAANVAREGMAATGWGPLAQLFSALVGGSGATIGEQLAPQNPEMGRAIGSTVLQLSPAAVRKIGAARELSDYAGNLFSDLFSRAADLPVVNRIPGVKSFADEMARASTEAAVGRTLGKVASTPEKTDEAAKALSEVVGPQTQLDSLKTVAERTGDAGLARAEDALSATNTQAPFKAMEAERAGVREASALRGFEKTEDIYGTSKRAEAAIEESFGNVEAVERATWNAIPKDLPIATDVDGLADDLARGIADIEFSGAMPLKGEAKGIVARFAQAVADTPGGRVSFEVLKDLRSKALELKRSTAARSTVDDRMTNDAADLIQGHILKIMDANASAGMLPDGVNELYQGARKLTRDKYQTFSAPRPGAASQAQGTSAVERMTLKDTPLTDAALIREGLNSPDRMAAQIAAAKAGGQDIAPMYRQALQAELSASSQSQWADIIARKRRQFEMTHTVDEMRQIDDIVADIAAQQEKARGVQIGNSLTAPRQAIAATLERGKGLAGTIQRRAEAQALPAIIGGAGGFNAGWESADTTPGALFRGLVLGAAGAITGKAVGTSGIRAAERYDSLLTKALTDPRAYTAAREATKPSRWGQIAGRAIVEGGAGAAARSAGAALRQSSKDGQVVESLGPSTQVAPESSLDEQQSRTATKAVDTRSLSKGQQGTPSPQSDPAAALTQDLFGKRNDSSELQNDGGIIREMFGAPEARAEGGGGSANLMKEEFGKKDIAAVEAEIDRDPYFSALYETESGRNPSAKNPESSAAGGFQFVSATAKALNVDPMDLADSFRAVQELTSDHIRMFGDDPYALYGAHYLGASLLRKVLDNRPLTDREAEIVKSFEEQALPRFKRIYDRIADKGQVA